MFARAARLARRLPLATGGVAAGTGLGGLAACEGGADLEARVARLEKTIGSLVTKLQTAGDELAGAVICAGAAHGPWKDDTYCKSKSDIHAPRYYNSWSDFGQALEDSKGELLLRDLLTKEMCATPLPLPLPLVPPRTSTARSSLTPTPRARRYDKFKDVKTSLGVTFDKCIKGGIDRAQLGPDWNVGKVGVLFGDAECVSLFRELMHPIIVARHGNPNLPHTVHSPLRDAFPRCTADPVAPRVAQATPSCRTRLPTSTAPSSSTTRRSTTPTSSRRACHTATPSTPLPTRRAL